MNTNRLAMHKEFLSEIREKRERLQNEMQRLSAVEAYHRTEVERLLGQTESEPANGVAESRPSIIDDRLEGLAKHAACRLAIKSLGGRAKTAEIAEWLRQRGYGTDLRKQVFHNTCFTAMKRRSDMFIKVGVGEWELVGNKET
jgi:hypothetical protein